MRYKTIDYVIGIAIAVMLVTLVLGAFGCYSLPAGSPTAIPTTGVGRLAGAVTSSGFMVPLSILGVALGVTAMFMGVGKIGLPAVLGSLAALVLTLVTQRYANLVAGLGAIVAAGGLVLGIVWKYRTVASTAASVGTALKQVVQGVQDVKAYVKGIDKDAVNKTLAADQDPKTQELVKNIKAELPSASSDGSSPASV